jgi:hypothetical protein
MEAASIASHLEDDRAQISLLPEYSLFKPRYNPQNEEAAWTALSPHNPIMAD